MIFHTATKGVGVAENKSLRFEKLGKHRVFALAELQERADHNPLDDGREQYRVWIGDQEAAYLSFDTFYTDQLNMYEIFVASNLWNMGIGTKIIEFAVELGKQMGKTRLTARPRPLSDQSLTDLITWYVNRGFTPDKNEKGLFEIKFAENDA
jgi:GNAT superfamily N-acetyltransferase